MTVLGTLLVSLAAFAGWCGGCVSAWFVARHFFLSRGGPGEKAPPTQATARPWFGNARLVIANAQATLVGNEIEWRADQPATYNCVHCNGSEEVELREYLHRPSGLVIGLLAHDCPGEQITEPIAIATVTRTGGEL